MLARVSSMALFVAMILSGAAHAADSSWLVCKGIAVHGDKQQSYFVANVLEHRYQADKRALDVALIYGANIGTGEVTDIDAGTLRVADVANKHVTFIGTGTLSADFKTFTLAGKIDFNFGALANARMERFAAKLSCDELDDLAIGH